MLARGEPEVIDWLAWTSMYWLSEVHHGMWSIDTCCCSRRRSEDTTLKASTEYLLKYVTDFSERHYFRDLMAN